MLDAAVFNKMFATTAQIQDIQSAILNAGIFSVCARMTTGFERDCWLLRKFAYLNRACELACAPVHVRPVETANGLDHAWYTYRPVARKPQRLLPPNAKLPTRWRHGPVPSEIEPIYLGLESDLTEDQARSKAIGW